MIASVVHTSLNARGGGERLAVATIKALSSIGIEVELATVEKPNMALIHDAYGRTIESDVKKIKTLGLFHNLASDITINTHGDMLPFFRHDFTKRNSIVYCHYPIAGHLMECSDPDYEIVLRNICLSTMAEKSRNAYFKVAKKAYTDMMTNSTILTNSEFSRKAIMKTFGVDSTVLYPPVDTDAFRGALASDVKDDSILVISRFHPSKKIENAISLARLLVRDNIGKHMTIVGNISPDGIGYFNYLRRLVKQCGVADFVRFEVNAKFERLLDLMRRAKVYVHPLPGEPFGISTVEAMSAGLVPVVPDIGGHTEFVPERYQFHTLGQGVEAVAAALDVPFSECIKISQSTQKYSTANYVKEFQRIVARVLEIEPIVPAPVIISRKMQPRAT